MLDPTDALAALRESRHWRNDTPYSHINLRLTAMERRRLQLEGAARGMSSGCLLGRMIEVICRDNLFLAVLDDGNR